MKIKLTEFSKRHFDKSFGGTKILDITPEEFERDINTSVGRRIPGYADFCTLFVVKNFTTTKTGTLPIGLDNYQYLRTGYSARTKDELPVMERWFELPLDAPIAEYLVVVLYSKEQLDKERKTNEPEFDADWGVVAILGQMTSDEEPMKPITMMRNALGIDEGGSGVPLNRKVYQKSVDFWSKHATVK